MGTHKGFATYMGQYTNHICAGIEILKHEWPPLFMIYSTLYLIETPFNAFANKADPDQASLVRAA